MAKGKIKAKENFNLCHKLLQVILVHVKMVLVRTDRIQSVLVFSEVLVKIPN